MLRKMEDNIVIHFLQLAGASRPYRRIIVNEQVEPHLDDKWVEELRHILSTGRNQYTTPENLQNPSVTTENRPSSIWAGFSSAPLGRKRNMEPRVPAKKTSAASAATPVPISQVVSQPHLLAATETRKIESWMGGISEKASPNVPVEPPSELVQEEEPKVGRQRRVAADSDDEDEPTLAAAALVPEDRGQATNVSSPVHSVSSSTNWIATNEVEETSGAVYPNREQNAFSTCAVPRATRRLDRLKIDSDNEELPSLPVHPATGTGRRRRIMTVDSSASDEDPEQPDAFWTVVGASAKRSFTLPWPSNEPEFGVPAIPASFDTNAYRGRGAAISRGWRANSAQAQNRGRGTNAQLSNQPVVGHDNRWAQNQVMRSAQGRSRGANSTRGSHASNLITAGLVVTRQSTRGRVRSHAQSPSRGSGRARSGPFGYGSRSMQYSSDASNFLDLAPTDNTTNTVMPPPGFEIRPEIPKPTCLGSINLIDEPLSDIQPPSISLAASSVWTQQPSPSIDPPWTSKTPPSSNGRDNVHRYNPGADVAAMQEEVIRVLSEKKKKEEADKALTVQQAKVNNRLRDQVEIPPQHAEFSSKEAGTLTQRLESEDEVATRRFHRTMRQGAPNPGRKAKPQKAPETKKEREARIAKAKAESHGEILIARKASPQIGHSSDDIDKDMSATKRRALKQGGAIAENNPVAAEDGLRTVQSKKLMQSLSPLFGAGRAFSGKLSFGIQFGQVLLAGNPTGGGTSRFIGIKEWHEKFQPLHGKFPIFTTFTNILTTNGADVDRILDMKSQALGITRVWHKTWPGPTTVCYEFQCQSKSSEEFLLKVNQDGKYEIQSTAVNVGMVNLHYPGQVWDACAVLYGHLNHNFSETLNKTAATFVSSLFIPPNQKNISITYRLPDTNEMTVKNLVMKRTSLHSCNIPDKQDFQLQITEVQILYHQFHKNDKKLGQAFVKDYDKMISDGRIHYEVSLVHEGIRKLLEKNKDLELGELTNKWTEKEVLQEHTCRTMVDLVTLVVSKMDGIGAKNIGTLYRKDMEKSAIVDDRTVILDPIASSRIAAMRVNPDATSHIPGVRGGKAEVTWEDGRAYALGFGFAKVPVPSSPMPRGVDEIGPLDSASQAPARTNSPGPVRYTHPAQAANISTNVRPGGVAGEFW